MHNVRWGRGVSAWHLHFLQVFDAGAPIASILIPVAFFLSVASPTAKEVKRLDESRGTSARCFSLPPF
jgi:hypothetical protein